MNFSFKKNRFINSVLSEKLVTEGVALASKTKKHVKETIVKKYINFSESSNGKIIKIKHKCGEISYSYQRENLEFHTKDWLKFLYNIEQKGTISQGTFFSSAIASISTLISILVRNNYKNFVFSDVPYFESYDFLINYFNSASVSEVKKFEKIEDIHADVLWIDSASPNFLSVNYKNIDSKIIVCDTSCLNCSCDYIRELVEFACNKNKTLFLARSHMKLDCFGLEINRLGSIVCVNDRDDIFNKVRTLKYFLGNNTSLSNIYPWLGYEDFFKFTTEDIKATQDINNIIENTIEENINHDKYDVVHFNHCIYFTIRLKKYTGDFNKLNSDVSKYCQGFNLPVNTTSSFYLEKIGVDNFERKLDNNSKFLRISSSAIKPEQAKEIAIKIANYLNNIT